MNRTRYILSLLFVLAVVFTSAAQDRIHLITDRTSCVSGDTIWFNAVLKNALPDNTGNVVHIQLDKLTNDHITRVSVLCKGNIAEGYLYVPDSLSTGVYLLKAFTNLQKEEKEASIHQRFITVYNRFETVVNVMNIPQAPNLNFDEISDIGIETRTPSSEKMEMEVKLPANLSNKTGHLIVTARLADPLADQLGKGWTDAPIRQNEEAFMPVRETKGLVVSGRVVSKATQTPKSGATVMLSISDTLPYFDYCIADEKGRFFFYLRNAVGTGNLVLQELADDQKDTEIELFPNYINTQSVNSEEQILSNEQRSFSTDLIKASYFDKFFNRTLGLAVDTFSMQKDFEYPFYGAPTKSFFPDLFVDLQDFAEISREILRGVQYRYRKGEASIRMLDYGTQSQFNEEPFKLLDGVPVLDPDYFSNMGTTKIKRVDAVFYKRFFGDLNFSGVLALYSNFPTLAWVESMPGMSLIRYSCLQPALNWDFASQNSRYSNIPDFNKVLLRQRVDELLPSNRFSFDFSDIQGDLIIEVTAVLNDNSIVQTRKLIEVKKPESRQNSSEE